MTHADNGLFRGYWYDTEGKQIGEVLRANDDGIVAPGTRYLELGTYSYDRRTRNIWLIFVCSDQLRDKA